MIVFYLVKTGKKHMEKSTEDKQTNKQTNSYSIENLLY